MPVHCSGGRDLYPEPEQFRPERFLGQQPAPWTWIPFGGGAHHRIGRSFAMMEMKLVILMLMRQFRFRTTDRHGEKAKRNSINFMPADGAPRRDRRARTSDGVVAAPAVE
jgi:cytochrome P450